MVACQQLLRTTNHAPSFIISLVITLTINLIVNDRLQRPHPHQPPLPRPHRRHPLTLVTIIINVRRVVGRTSRVWNNIRRVFSLERFQVSDLLYIWPGMRINQQLFVLARP